MDAETLLFRRTQDEARTQAFRSTRHGLSTPPRSWPEGLSLRREDLYEERS